MTTNPNHNHNLPLNLAPTHSDHYLPQETCLQPLQHPIVLVPAVFTAALDRFLQINYYL